MIDPKKFDDTGRGTLVRMEMDDRHACYNKLNGEAGNPGFLLLTIRISRENAGAIVGALERERSVFVVRSDAMLAERLKEQTND